VGGKAKQCSQKQDGASNQPMRHKNHLPKKKAGLSGEKRREKQMSPRTLGWRKNCSARRRAKDEKEIA